MITASINYRRVQMEVLGNFTPATPNSRTEPGDHPKFFMEEIWIGDQEVSALLKADHAAIESAALDWCEDNPAEIRRQQMEASYG